MVICYTCHKKQSDKIDFNSTWIKYTNSRHDTYDYCSQYCADGEHYAQCNLEITKCSKCIKYRTESKSNYEVKNVS